MRPWWHEQRALGIPGRSPGIRRCRKRNAGADAKQRYADVDIGRAGPPGRPGVDDDYVGPRAERRPHVRNTTIRFVGDNDDIQLALARAGTTKRRTQISRVHDWQR